MGGCKRRRARRLEAYWPDAIPGGPLPAEVEVPDPEAVASAFPPLGGDLLALFTDETQMRLRRRSQRLDPFRSGRREQPWRRR